MVPELDKEHFPTDHDKIVARLPYIENEINCCKFLPIRDGMYILMIIELVLLVLYITTTIELSNYARDNYEAKAKIILSKVNACEIWSVT